MSKQELLRKKLAQIVGEENVVAREKDWNLRDDKGKLVRDKVSAHTIGVLESRLQSFQKLEVGISAFGKKAVIEVDPRNMNGLSVLDRACAVAAQCPELAVKDEVSSVSGKLVRKACGEAIAEHVGAIVGNDDVGNAMIVAAAVLGKYGKKLDAELSNDEETPSEKNRKTKSQEAAPAANESVAPAVVS